MKKLAVLILAAMAAMPVQAAPAADTSTPSLDLNEVICRTVSVTGSRLGASRRCATRGQWLEDERAQRSWTAERQLRQTNPQCMNPGERMRVSGRYASSAIGGGVVSCE